MKRKKLFLSAAFSAAFLFGAVNVQAYELTGQKWADQTISYYYTGSNPIASKAFKSAASQWNKNSNANFKSSSKNHAVSCSEVQNKNVDWDGNTTWTYYNENNITYKADVYLNTAMPAWKDSKALQSVAVHEFGHVLGLAHCPGKNIMNPFTFGSESRYGDYKLSVPQADDIKGVNSLYKAAAPAKKKHSSKSSLPVEYMHASWSHNYDSIEETSKNSDMAALIKVTGTEKEYTDENNLPYTNYSAEILDSVSKDNNDKKDITIVMTGVDNDNRHVELDDDPLLNEDEEFLVFLKENEDGTYKIVGGPSGRFVFDKDSNSVTSLCLSDEKVQEANPYEALQIENENADNVLKEASKSMR